MLAPGLHTGADNSQAQPAPALMNACLIAANVGQLVTLYESVLGIKAQRSGTELGTDGTFPNLSEVGSSSLNLATLTLSIQTT